MARYLAALVVWGLLTGPAFASSNYIYPLPDWQVSTTHGEDIGGGLYHMGVDAGFGLPAGAPVYAVADGIVREAQERSQFGLVVLIEQAADTDQAQVSLYGHLDPTNVQVTPGQSVLAGDQIGVLGNSSNNGGWTTHLHFGIHKSPYTGDWVYYGHVYDPETAADWYNPEKYIPKHFVSDTWQPTIDLDLVDGDIVGNTVDLTGTVGDLGAGVQKLTLRASSDAITWSTLAVYDNPEYIIDAAVDISTYSDGTLYLKLVARDGYTEKTVVQRTVMKDPYRYTTPGFVAMKSGASDAFVTQWSFGGTVLNAWFPFNQHWSAGGLLAVGDITAETDLDIIAVRKAKAGTTPLVKILSATGTVLAHFKLPQQTPLAVTTAPSQVIIASQVMALPVITAYTETGVVQWSFDRFDPTLAITGLATTDTTLYVCGELNSRSIIYLLDLATQTITNQFRPFSKHLQTGCRVTTGDLDGDSNPEIIVGTTGGVPASVKAFTASGALFATAVQPFGDTFTGAVDVRLMQWDTTETGVTEDELLVSQASAGQAWVKVYNLTDEDTVILTKRVYEEEFTKGAQIVGWQ
ncbi:MAG: M23 family metallopeptidase [Candidatus Kerfeldbacteria bacterium]|nr:M23 family metallopeptidase [Candidatus Kerfeldbacteria bacterium]